MLLEHSDLWKSSVGSSVGRVSALFCISFSTLHSVSLVVVSEELSCNTFSFGDKTQFDIVYVSACSVLVNLDATSNDLWFPSSEKSLLSLISDVFTLYLCFSGKWIGTLNVSRLVFPSSSLSVTSDAITSYLSFLAKCIGPLNVTRAEMAVFSFWDLWDRVTSASVHADTMVGVEVIDGSEEVEKVEAPVESGCDLYEEGIAETLVEGCGWCLVSRFSHTTPKFKWLKTSPWTTVITGLWSSMHNQSVGDFTYAL